MTDTSAASVPSPPPVWIGLMRRRPTAAWPCSALLFLAATTAPAQGPNSQDPPRPAVTMDEEPITAIPAVPAADPLKVALGERLFQDSRLSHDGDLACLSCHDTNTNGADREKQRVAQDGSKSRFDTPTVFNAALNFRLNWEGNYRTLEAQAEAALENPMNMKTSVDEVLGKLKTDPEIVGQFERAYGRLPDRTSFLDAIATYERSLLTPGSRFDHWLGGDPTALTSKEQSGYQLFKSFGCVSCHQGVNVGGNLFERSGVFRPLTGSGPELLRVPSLRNVATTPPYFHDGSAPTLNDAVRRMGAAQLNRTLSDQQIDEIVAFLQTLTGNYREAPVVGASP